MRVGSQGYEAEMLEMDVRQTAAGALRENSLVGLLLREIIVVALAPVAARHCPSIREAPPVAS